MQPTICDHLRLLDRRIATALQDLCADMEKLAVLTHQRAVLMEELARRWRAQCETAVLESERRGRELGHDG